MKDLDSGSSSKRGGDAKQIAVAHGIGQGMDEAPSDAIP